MSGQSKRQKHVQEKCDTQKQYDVLEAIQLLKELSKQVKFNESLDAAVRLGVDPRKSDQTVRGAAVLPHGTGRDVRVAVFAQEGEQANAAKAAGAERVGFEDLAEDIKKGNIDFDVLIATPAAMRLVGQLGQILGPKGLMPNPKVGTVSQDVAGAVKRAKAGQVMYRAEKAGIVHCTIGKADFADGALKENLVALIGELKKAKPATAKGIYLRKVVLSTTMGPGLTIDVATL